MIQVPDLWLTFAVATVLPALVALVTSKFASSKFKGVVLAALSALTGVVTSLQATDGALDLKVAFTSFVITFVTAVAVHYGLLKPVGLTGSNGAVANAVPSGLGKSGN